MNRGTREARGSTRRSFDASACDRGACRSREREKLVRVSRDRGTVTRRERAVECAAVCDSRFRSPSKKPRDRAGRG
eukprot:31159-Pelagococcus_subviridis.AAC.5